MLDDLILIPPFLTDLNKFYEKKVLQGIEPGTIWLHFTIFFQLLVLIKFSFRGIKTKSWYIYREKNVFNPTYY